MKRIPISAAKEISNKYDAPEVVVFAYDPETGLQHITTYGKTKDQCVDASKAGNFFKKALGWSDELCHAEPSRSKKVKNESKVI